MKKYYRKHSPKGEQAKPNMIAVVDSQDMWNKGPQSITTQCYVDAKDLPIGDITLGELVSNYSKLLSKAEKVEKVYKFLFEYAKNLNITAQEIKGEAKDSKELRRELIKERNEKQRLFNLIAEEFTEGDDE